MIEPDLLVDTNFVVELMDSWGVSKETQSVFEEHDLDIDCLENITESDINELIPKSKIKDRIKFKAGLTRFRNENKSLSMCTATTDDIDSKSVASSSGDSSSSSRTAPNPETHFDLQTILKSTNTGLMCLQSTNKKIDTTMRNYLTKSIVDYYIKECGSMKTEDFDDISNQILKLFPSESKEIYYVPSRKYGKKSYIPARGKLVDRYHNQRRLLRKSGLIGKRQAPSLTDVIEEPHQSDLSPEEEDELKLWLKYNKEPWTEIMVKWKSSKRLRSQDLSSSDKSIQDICNEWPALKTSLGYKLIESDFEEKYKNCDLILFKKWPLFIEKALPVYEKLKSCEDILKNLNEDSSDDFRDYIYLKLLSWKMPPTVKVQLKNEGKKKTFYKPSIIESENSLILHVTNQSEILTRTKLRQEEHLAKGLTCQPLIIAVGPSAKEVKDFYVFYESVTYKLDSLLKAVDVCFKIFHVFNAEYPTESISVWTFIQKYFYEIECKTDKKISNVASFIADLS